MKKSVTFSILLSLLAFMVAVGSYATVIEKAPEYHSSALNADVQSQINAIDFSLDYAEAAPEMVLVHPHLGAPNTHYTAMSVETFAGYVRVIRPPPDEKTHRCKT